MPGLQVHRKGSFALAAALVHVASRVVEYTEQGDQAVRRSVGAADVRPRRTDVVNAQSNATGTLADFGTLLQGVVDAVDAVVLHLEQEATGHLWLGGACIEKRRGGVGVKPL